MSLMTCHISSNASNSSTSILTIVESIVFITQIIILDNQEKNDSAFNLSKSSKTDTSSNISHLILIKRVSDKFLIFIMSYSMLASSLLLIFSFLSLYIRKEFFFFNTQY